MFSIKGGNNTHYDKKEQEKENAIQILNRHECELESVILIVVAKDA
jgi:hypothetical protein